MPRAWLYGCVLLFLICLLFRPLLGGLKQARANTWMQQGRQIGQMMFSYATDNYRNGNSYPDGNSSTEVFQKLLDGGYCTDPAIFYLPLPGKIKAVPGQKLKPENVCWDVTGGIDESSSDGIPLLFMTGYKVSYTPGAAAIPLVKPYPNFRYQQTFLEWLSGLPDPSKDFKHGVAIFYKGNNAAYIVIKSDGTITNFVSPDFQPDGKTYRQLTPDGSLPGN